jgi:AraC-like DNA-binding protein
MKIKFEDIKTKQGDRSFWAFGFESNHFRFNLHYHPEYELTYISNGKGERMIGDALSQFEEGDLVLLDANLPHTWLGQGFDYQTVVVQFSPKFINSFLQWTEFQKIKNLLAKAKNGLAFPQEATVIQKIKNIVQLTDFEQVISLLEVLNQLADLPCESLSQTKVIQLNTKTESRINTICQYIQENYSQNLDLPQVANLIHLSESAFCKFFKKTTSKTFSEYLNYIRIKAIGNDLKMTDKTIAEIAFANGFESLTYFNRVFKREAGMTPKEFRQMSIKSL